MRVTVVIPVGPGHENSSLRTITTVENAWNKSQGPFTEIFINAIPDHKGELGRSRARNIGMETDTDWYFLIDADDAMEPDAFSLCLINHDATFGAIKVDGKISKQNHPCNSFHSVVRHGAEGTLSMGFFLNSIVDLRFNESMDIGEDWYFYIRLVDKYDFIKIEEPLVNISLDIPSAHGPRGYTGEVDWVKIGNKIIDDFTSPPVLV